MSKDHAIGVFDSGIGGLTVVRALMERLPHESIIYFGDTARLPYGVKSAAAISRYAQAIATFLLQEEVKLLIVACNTMSAVAYEDVVALSPVPVLEVIDAGARQAVAASPDKRIGVIGTPVTIASKAYEKRIHTFDSSAIVLSQACSLFVPLVEEGWIDHPVTRLTAEEYLRPLLNSGIDTLVLGCTHYPLIKPLLQEVVGPQVRLVDSAEAMAIQVSVLLRECYGEDTEPRKATYRYYVTDIPLRFQAIAERFLGRAIGQVHIATLPI